jgi:hypothetical protein
MSRDSTTRLLAQYESPPVSGFLDVLRPAVQLTRSHFARIFSPKTRILRVNLVIGRARLLRKTALAHNYISLARAKLYNRAWQPRGVASGDKLLAVEKG